MARQHNVIDFYGQNSLRSQGLGLIPAWQFSTDPNVNPNINRYCSIPPGWPTQTSPTQPLPPVAGPSITLMPPAQAAMELGLPIFDSWWWEHRKALAIGGAAIVGVGLLAGIAALLR